MTPVKLCFQYWISLLPSVGVMLLQLYIYVKVYSCSVRIHSWNKHRGLEMYVATGTVNRFGCWIGNCLETLGNCLSFVRLWEITSLVSRFRFQVKTLLKRIQLPFFFLFCSYVVDESSSIVYWVKKPRPLEFTVGSLWVSTFSKDVLWNHLQCNWYLPIFSEKTCRSHNNKFWWDSLAVRLSTELEAVGKYWTSLNHMSWKQKGSYCALVLCISVYNWY